MLGAELRNLEREIRGVNDILPYAGDFIAEHQCIFLPFLGLEPVKHHRIYRLLYADYLITLLLEPADRIHGVVYMLPCNTVFGTKCGLVYLWRRRDRADSAKPDFVCLEGIGRPEGRAHIVRAADIVKDYHNA